LKAACTIRSGNCTSWPSASATSVSIAAPGTAVVPIVAVSAPSNLGTCDTLTLDLSGSTGSGGRAWPTFVAANASAVWAAVWPTDYATEQPANATTVGPTNQSAEYATQQPAHKAAVGPAFKPAEYAPIRATNKSANFSTYQSAHVSAHETAVCPTDQPTNWTAEQSAHSSTI
jgi:hypothetical protein